MGNETRDAEPSSLDEELAALADAVDDEPEGTARAPEHVGDDAATRERAPGGRGKSVGLLVMLLAMMAGIVVLFTQGFEGAAVYSMPLKTLVDNPEEHAGTRVRIEGELVPGSLVKREKPCEYRFVLREQIEETERGKVDLDALRRLAVRFPQCIVPDAFRDVPEGGVLVTVTGELTDGHFQATEIMAQCASKYDPKTHEMKPPAEQAAVQAP
ncbi:MAG: cytochrome c maturation protein CcmE [Myxococcota bacterium]